MLRATALPDNAGAGEKCQRYFGDVVLELGDGDLDLGKEHRVGLLDGLRNGRGDLDRAKGRRISGGDVNSLGLCFAPGGARGWLVGQKLKPDSRARA